MGSAFLLVGQYQRGGVYLTGQVCLIDLLFIDHLLIYSPLDTLNQTVSWLRCCQVTQVWCDVLPWLPVQAAVLAGVRECSAQFGSSQQPHGILPVQRVWSVTTGNQVRGLKVGGLSVRGQGVRDEEEVMAGIFQFF